MDIRPWLTLLQLKSDLINMKYYLIGRNFVRRNFRRAKLLVGRNFRHLLEKSLFSLDKVSPYKEFIIQKYLNQEIHESNSLNLWEI